MRSVKRVFNKIRSESHAGLIIFALLRLYVEGNFEVNLRF